MAQSASSYVVFKAEECVSSVAQPIAISQCLRLTPKKLAPIKSSSNKLSSNSLREGFSKKHVQLAFAWHVNIFIIPATWIAERTFPVRFIVVLYLMEIICFSLLFLNAATRERDLLVYRGSPAPWIDQFAYMSSFYLFDQYMSAMSFIS